MKFRIFVLCIVLVSIYLLECVQSSPLDIQDTTLQPTIKITTEKTITVEEAVIQKNSTSTVQAGATCSCSNTESPVCASNGVTYKNSCRFECTKKRVKRLRVVKNGSCNGISLNQYRTRPRNY